MLREIKNWRVNDEPTLSDHMKIVFEIDITTEPVEKYIRNPRYTNWEGYTKDLEGALQCFPKNLRDTDALERAATMFSESILGAFEKNCQEVRVGKKRTCWWNRNLEKLKRHTRQLFRKARKDNNRISWVAYAKARDNYRAEIRKAQKESWAAFCEDIETGADAARLDRILSRNPDAILGALMTPNGSYTTTDEETLAQLIEAHFPGFIRSGEDGGAAVPNPSGGGEAAARDANQLGFALQVARKIVSPCKIRWAIGSFSPYFAASHRFLFTNLKTFIQKSKENCIVFCATRDVRIRFPTRVKYDARASARVLITSSVIVLRPAFHILFFTLRVTRRRISKARPWKPNNCHSVFRRMYYWLPEHHMCIGDTA